MSLTVKSTTDTSDTGTRSEVPVSFPNSSGMTLPTALAAPVLVGIIFSNAVRPRRQFFLLKPSTELSDAVTACTVVIRPSSMPQVSFTIFAMGARQLVVQLALETNFMSEVYLSLFTPMTNIGVPSLEGADMTTCFAPASRWP